MTPRLIFAAVLTLIASLGAEAQWPQFRGPNSAGISEQAVPIEFGPGNNELWSLPLDAGHSSPCIVGDAIFLTTFNQKRGELAVVCIDRELGTIRWKRLVAVEQLETGHPSFNPASSTPASDGERVVAYFGSYGLICFDMQGEKLWEIRMPLTKSYAGNATSPAIFGDRAILYRGNHVDHFLLAVDKHSGKELWRVQQDEPFHSELACTACPIVFGNRLIAHTARSVQAFDLESGDRQWVAKCATTATSTPVIAGDQVIVAAWNKMGEPALRPEFPTFADLVAQHDQNGDGLIGKVEFPRLMIFHRPDGAEAPQNGASIRFRQTDANGDGNIDAEEWKRMCAGIEKFRAGYKTHGMLAIPIDSLGIVGPADIRTLATEGIPEVPSPLAYQGRVYFLKNGGILSCLDLAEPDRITRVRTGGRGTHYASPIIADGKIYCTAGDGTISVLSLDGRPKLLAKNQMDDLTYATPAIAEGVLYVRTHSGLYAFGAEFSNDVDQ